MWLKGKVSIITGASRGIGRAIASKFAREGARVLICDLEAAEVAFVVEEIREQGGDAFGFKVDVTNAASIHAMVHGAVTRYGRIDVLVNNAGIVMDAQLKDMSDEQFDKVIDVNLKGTYNCTRAVVDVMLSQRCGVILNTSSIVGLHGNFGQTNYAASKFGVIGMTKTWARELGKSGIRVNVVCPGSIETSILQDMPQDVLSEMLRRTPLRRLGKPEEVANAFAFLASDEASYIHGAVLEVSGGMIL